MLAKKAFCLRVYVYQCRGLPSIDENGLIDPYVKVRFAGMKKKTVTRKETQNPAYYECLEFNQMLPEDLRLAPSVLLQVWDVNFMSSKTPVAALRVPANELFLSSHLANPPAPEWRELKGIDGKGKMGEVLVAFHLIQKKDMSQIISSAKDINPPLKKVYLDIHTIGTHSLTGSYSLTHWLTHWLTHSPTHSPYSLTYSLTHLLTHSPTHSLIGIRNLIKSSMLGIRNPFITYDVASHSYGASIQTATSRVPTSTNPNFLDRQILQVMMPEDPLLAPTLEVRVYDQRIRNNILLGSTNIDLRHKLPWNR